MASASACWTPGRPGFALLAASPLIEAASPRHKRTRSASRQVSPRGGDARGILPRDGHTWCKDNLGIGQRRRETFEDRDRIGGIPGHRPWPEHVGARIGKRTNDSDAAQLWRQRQHMVIGEKDN